MDNLPLSRKALHRALAIRLALAGVLIAIALGVTVLLVERRSVGEAVSERVVQGALTFNIHASEVLESPTGPDPENMQREVDNFFEKRMKYRRVFESGAFVLMRIFDLGGRELAVWRDESYEFVDPVYSNVKTPGDQALASRDPILSTQRITGKSHVVVVTPLMTASGEHVASLQAVFAVSSQAMAKAGGRAMKAMAYAMGTVLLTTVLLYPVLIRLMRRVTALTFDLLDSHIDTLKVLGSAIAKRDSDTDIHNYRVTITSVRIAEAMGLDPESIMALIKGAFLHDVGKIGIPDGILLKPGRLDEHEFGIMMGHVNIGLDIIGRSGWLKDAVQVVGGHHEKVAGNGYPKGISGDRIPLLARIFAVADVFDALTSKRPYKEPFPFDESMSILSEDRGSHFDTNVLDAFQGIARSVYDDLSGRNNTELKSELESIVKRYFI